MSDEPGGDGDLDLSTLDDEDLTAQMHDDLYDGLADEMAKVPKYCFLADGLQTKY